MVGRQRTEVRVELMEGTSAARGGTSEALIGAQVGCGHQGKFTVERMGEFVEGSVFGPRVVTRAGVAKIAGAKGKEAVLRTTEAGRATDGCGSVAILAKGKEYAFLGRKAAPA